MVCNAEVDRRNLCSVLAGVFRTQLPHNKMGLAAPLDCVNPHALPFCWGLGLPEQKLLPEVLRAMGAMESFGELGRRTFRIASSLQGHVMTVSQTHDGHT